MDVTGLTADRMLGIENSSVVSGSVDTAGNLTLTTRDGTQIAAGNIKGPRGATGAAANVVYIDTFGADPTGVADSSAAYAAALAALPSVTVSGNIWRRGRIVFGAGVYRFNTAIPNTGPLLRLEGQGRWLTTIMYYGAGPCVSIVGHNTGTFNTLTFGGSIHGLSIDGSNAAAGATGLLVTDGEEITLDVAIQHFNKAGSVGFNQHNTATRWTEKVDARLMLFDNTTNFLLNTDSSTSMEYCEWDVTLYCNPQQDGVVLGDNVYLGGCTLKVRGNLTSADPATATNAAFRIGNNVQIYRARLEWSVESTNGAASTNVPLPLVMGSNVKIKAWGRLGWNIGAAWRNPVIGSGLVWDFVGHIYNAPTLGALLNAKPITGVLNITIPSGFSSASVTLNYGVTFDNPPNLILSAGTGGSFKGLNAFNVFASSATVQVFTTDRANVSAATVVTVYWAAYGNW